VQGRACDFVLGRPFLRDSLNLGRSDPKAQARPRVRLPTVTFNGLRNYMI